MGTERSALRNGHCRGPVEEPSLDVEEVSSPGNGSLLTGDPADILKESWVGV